MQFLIDVAYGVSVGALAALAWRIRDQLLELSRRSDR